MTKREDGWSLRPQKLDREPGGLTVTVLSPIFWKNPGQIKRVRDAAPRFDEYAERTMVFYRVRFPIYDNTKAGFHR
ncbi:MAG: hypothetical protein L0Z73_08890 [Gammaproteobacteria bacterium]|nr:hypothetical protein [Gammaproteobacteria bacterium]